MSNSGTRLRRLFPLAAALSLAFLGLGGCGGERTSRADTNTLEPRTRMPTGSGTSAPSLCAPNDLAQIPYAVVSGPSRINSGVCAGPFTAILYQMSGAVCMTAQPSGQPANEKTWAAPQDMPMFLWTERPSVRFFTDPGCTMRTNAMLVRAGQIGARFYVADTSSTSAILQTRIGVDSGEDQGNETWLGGELSIRIHPLGW